MALAFESPLSHTIPKMDSGLQHPQSALARGVHIMDLSDGCTNPEPILFQETDILMEQYLSPTKLQALTGCDKLETVINLEMKVDSSETSLNNFGAMLPNLKVLRLSGSIIPNIRDLGSALHNLEVLWMSRCGLEELDGISSMLRLRELYLSYNEISDISPLGMLEELEILDLEGNNVDDIGQVQYLTLCTKLMHLTLDGNPICVTPNVDSQEVNYNYRQAVKKILGNLTVLDDKPLADCDTGGPGNVFDADWAYLEKLQQDALAIESSLDQDNNAVSSVGRPTTAALRPATSYRPGSALRPSSGFRPSSSLYRPASISGGRPSSAWMENSKHKRPVSSDAAEGLESSSELTLGMVICGNPSNALRARRQTNIREKSMEQPSQSVTSRPLPQTPTEASQTSPVKPQIRSRGGGEEEGSQEEEEAVAGDTVEAEFSDEQTLCLLMKELNTWKTEHEKRLEKIRQSKAPQVFTINHNDSGSDPYDNQSDLSDIEDLDLRPDSAMDRYCRQEAERSHHLQQQQQQPLGNATKTASFSVCSRAREARTTISPEEGSRCLGRELTKKPQMDEQKLEEYEHSLDENEHLLKEYQRLQELQEKVQATSPPTSGEPGISGSPLELRELRVPSAGLTRPYSPRRGVSPKPAPFPVGSMGMSTTEPAAVLGAGLESSAFTRDQRPRKIKIGPTGLPGSSHSQQPQIRDVLTPPGKPGFRGLVPSSTLRPPSSSSSSSSTLQNRIQRTLPEVLPLPSHPPPVTKS